MASMVSPQEEIHCKSVASRQLPLGYQIDGELM